MTLRVVVEDKRIIVPGETELNPENIRKIINTHKSNIAPQFRRMKRMYIGDHDILHKKKKTQYKPDHRLVANYSRFLVDTFVGYFTGIPVKITHKEENIDAWVQEFIIYTGLEDTIAEIAKSCDEYGSAPVLLYMDEDAMPCLTLSTPMESFVVYDDSILHRPLWGVRYYRNSENKLEGTISDSYNVYTFNSECKIIDEKQHPFNGVPIIDFVENAERIGLIESVETLINAFNDVLSEKANDIDYFSDAYLKILGKKIDTDTIKNLRDNRIINMAGKDTDKLIVEFLQKPDADATSEHLLDRLTTLIFNLSMVANISDDNFGNASGTALAYKLQPMDNLAKMKSRKFTASLQQVFRLLSNVPTTKIDGMDWTGLNYQFTQNIPRNLLEESQIAKNLKDIVSDETIMRVISVVQDVKAEMEKLQKQREEEDADIFTERD